MNDAVIYSRCDVFEVRVTVGAATSLFMVPILAVAAVFILHGVRKRGREI